MLCSISPCDFSQNINNLNLCEENSCAIELEKKRIQKIQKQRERSYAYYLKIKESPGYKEKNILAKQQFYEKHKIRIRETERLKYQNDLEHRLKVQNRACLKYLEKTANIPKQKRGRKPLFIDDTPTDDETPTEDITIPLPKMKRNSKPKVITDTKVLGDTNYVLPIIKKGRKPKVITDTEVIDDTDSVIPKNIRVIKTKKVIVDTTKTLPI